MAAMLQFLTNVFFIPFLAQRAAPEPIPEGASKPLKPPTNQPLPSWAPVLGGVGLGVGLLSIGWALAARPEYGDLAARWQYFVDTFNSNRVFYAFIVDAGLYCIWQAALLADAPAKHRFVPFFGLAAHLLEGNSNAKTAK